MPLTNADVDAAVPVGGNPSRALTNAALKTLIQDVANAVLGLGTPSVTDFASLPAASTKTGQFYYVQNSTGVWLINRRNKGLYVSDGTNWNYVGDFPQTGDQVGFTPAGNIAATNVQSAIYELDTEKAAAGAVTASGLTMATARLLGRTTAGTGALEELTGTAATAILDVFTTALKGLVPASGGGTTNFLRADGTWAVPAGGSGSPGGSSGTIQFNNGGAFGGAANAEIEGNELRLDAISTPTAPAAGGVKMYATTIGNRVMPAYLDPLGGTGPLQAQLARKRIAYVSAINSATTLTGFGIATGLTFSGTATAANIGTTNLFASTRRVDALVTVAATNAVAGLRGVNQYMRGNAAGVGGYYLNLVGGPATGPSTTSGTMRFCMGFFSLGGAPTDVDPSSLTNIIALACDAADTNMQIMHNDSAGTCTKIDLGASFPKPTVDRQDFYDLTVYCAPNASDVYYRVENRHNGNVATGTLNTNLPANTVILAPYMYCSVGGTNSVVGFTFMQFYGEVDN